MILSNDFISRWNKDVFPLVKYDNKKVNLLDIPQEAKDFLIEAGLPHSAAPYLNFESTDKDGATRLSEKYKNSKLSNYIYLGFTGNGDLICIKEKSGEIVIVDHENGKNEYFLNSSISQLAEYLLEYYNFVQKIKQVNGRKAFLERNAPKELVDWIWSILNKVDSNALDENCFWKEELSHFIK